MAMFNLRQMFARHSAWNDKGFDKQDNIAHMTVCVRERCRQDKCVFALIEVPVYAPLPATSCSLYAYSLSRSFSSGLVLRK